MKVKLAIYNVMFITAAECNKRVSDNLCTALECTLHVKIEPLEKGAKRRRKNEKFLSPLSF